MAILVIARLGAAEEPEVSPETDRKIEEAIAASYNFRTMFEDRVAARSEGGIVTLTGTVEDRHQKALATDTVRSLPGVRDVHNHLDVRTPGRERPDGWIALKIRALLLVRSDVSAAGTQVAVRDGIVTLSGVAASVEQKELTEAYARGVEGVRSVRNEMRVVEAPRSAGSGDSADASRS